MKNGSLLTACLCAIIALSLIAFFIRPHAPNIELVTPKDELASFQARYPGDENLANRILKSYELAFILVQSPYLSTNIGALEGIREWARDQFQSHPDFLHPVSVAAPADNHDTVFGAIGYNLIAPLHYWCQQRVADLVRVRVANFHHTQAYQSFNKSFFDIYGKDADAATLLARYESDRAKQALDPFLWAALWAACTAGGAAWLTVNARRDFFGALQTVTAATWCVLTGAYLSQSWASGRSSDLISACASALLALYLFKPFMVASHKEARHQRVFIRLAPCWIAVSAWFTLSCIAIQILTWMRTGIPANPDPITLLLGTFSGNFLQDPIAEKRVVTFVISAIWLLFTSWTLVQRGKDQPYCQEPDDHFLTLDRPLGDLDYARRK